MHPYRHPKVPSRRVRCDSCRSAHRFDDWSDEISNTKTETRRTCGREIALGLAAPRSYHTLRDGSFEGRFPRHFVPGYDRCCPYGDCRTSAKNELFSCFWTIKTACPPFKNACTGILERRLFQNGQSPTAPYGTRLRTFGNSI